MIYNHDHSVLKSQDCRTDLSSCVQLAHHAVVGEVVGHEEGGADGTAVGVSSAAIWREEAEVELPVVPVDRVIKGDEDHLRHFFRLKAARYRVS